MRVKFYPSGQMRYITPDEWRAGQYAEEDISARNRQFLMRQEHESVEEEDFYDPLAEDMARLEASRLEAVRLEAPSQEQEQEQQQQHHHHHQVEVEQLEVSNTRFQIFPPSGSLLLVVGRDATPFETKKKNQLDECFTNT